MNGVSILLTFPSLSFSIAYCIYALICNTVIITSAVLSVYRQLGVSSVQLTLKAIVVVSLTLGHLI
jgi:hypothetical protein